MTMKIEAHEYSPPLPLRRRNLLAGESRERRIGTADECAAQNVEAMKERPIYFKQPFADQMIQAILEGRKTQMRIPIEPQPNSVRFNQVVLNGYGGYTDEHGSPLFPAYEVGDRLWVRETWQANTMPTGWPYYYRATDDDVISPPWKSPLFMPRAASRILLEITDVRVERLHEITEEDAIAEGEKPDVFLGDTPTAIVLFALRWQAIHGPESLDQNPWVRVITLKKIQP